MCQNLPDPTTRRNQVNRLFNLLKEVKTKNFHAKAGIELIKKFKTKTKEPCKIIWNVPKLLQWWKAHQTKPSEWEEIRNNAILFYLLSSGRRASNAACAIQPKYKVKGKGILFTEIKTKTDHRRDGIHWCLLPASDITICPVRILETYLEHPHTQHLIAQVMETHPESLSIPLFLTSDKHGVPRGLSADRISTILKLYLQKAEVDRDSLGRKVLPSFIRHTVLTRATLARVPAKFVKQMQGRKQDKCEHRFYLLEGALIQWSDFILHIRDDIDTSPKFFKTIADVYEEDKKEMATDDPSFVRERRSRKPNPKYFSPIFVN